MIARCQEQRCGSGVAGLNKLTLTACDTNSSRMTKLDKGEAGPTFPVGRVRLSEELTRY